MGSHTFSGTVSAIMVASLVLAGARCSAQETGDGAAERSRFLTLRRAVDLALRQGYALEVSREEVEQARQDEARAFSELLPQVSGSVGYTRIDRDRARLSFGATPLQDVSAGVSVRQIVFNDPAISGWRASTHQTRLNEYRHEATRLDAAAAAATAYVQWLSAAALLRIEQSNLSANEEYLDLAERRRDAGTGRPEEVYRWEAAVASRRGAVIRAESDVRSALAQLNMTMGVPLESDWHGETLTIGEDDYFFVGRRVCEMVAQQPPYSVSVGYGVATLHNNSPELKALDAAITAQGIAVRQLERRFVVPEVGAELSYNYRLWEDYAGSPDGGGEFDAFGGGTDDEEWVFSVSATWPLFEGGGKKADLAGAKSELRRLHAVRRQTREMLEQRLRNAIYAAGSSYPNIALTREAAAAARRNLQVIQDKYKRGKASILDLVDAQNQSFVQEQSAVIAVYKFMTDTIETERAMAWLEFLRPEEEARAWLEGLRKRLESHDSLL